jgi:hypothetical protein
MTTWILVIAMFSGSNFSYGGTTITHIDYGFDGEACVASAEYLNRWSPDNRSLIATCIRGPKAITSEK